MLDQALRALVVDLASKGMLVRTLVVLATEFGRTPRINENSGRDHHSRAFTCLLAWAGVKGGQVYGKSDARGFEVEDDQVTVPDFNATIAHAMDLPLKKVVKSPGVRAFTVAHKGEPVTVLF